jgi:predicted choloylglycine hydrolase
MECAAALAEHMPELEPVHRKLTELAGGGDRAARFLSTWRPPQYLGGCSLAAIEMDGDVRLVRNYDLSPELNEGLLLRSEWTGSPVMGMVEFLWGLSDGVNAAGLAAAIAYGGRGEVARGFGVTTILRYVLETCATVAEAVAALHRVPSHMAYNLVLADRTGTTAAVELMPGGGANIVQPAVATNHQLTGRSTHRPGWAQTTERRNRLKQLLAAGGSLDGVADAFLEAPLFRRNYAAGFGTLFTALYDPSAGVLTLRWPGQRWRQSLDDFIPGSRTIHYSALQPKPAHFELGEIRDAIRPLLSPHGKAALDRWMVDADQGNADWARFGQIWGAEAWMLPTRSFVQNWRAIN